jgi:transcriptional regulator with XRE-family HTH domain
LIERGRSIPRLNTLLVISEHLGVAVSELLSRQETITHSLLLRRRRHEIARIT